MANTFKFGAGEWYGKKDTILAYNDENKNYKPLPFTFSRDSTGTIVNKDGLIETVGIDEPRVDYLDNANGHLLLEPSRTNLILSSENISGAGWGRSGWTLTNDFISPDGTNNAYSILRTTGASFAATLSLSANTTYTYSVYIKNVDATNIQLRVQNSAGNSSGTESNCIVFQVTDQTNTDDFVRITHTFNTGDAGSYGIFLGYYSAGEYIVWGAQLEQGSYATSYIPTQGSIGTRVAETCSGAGNEQVFNDSEGVLFAEISALSETETFRDIRINDGSSNNRVAIRYSTTTNEIEAYVVSNGTETFKGEYVSQSTVSFNKIAIKYKNNDFSLWINGIEIVANQGKNGGGTPVNLNNINFSTSLFNFYGNTKQIKYFNQALTDAELQALTSN